MIKAFNRVSLLLVFLISQSAIAANAVRVDAKKVLGLQVGTYKVSKADSAFEKENLCYKNNEIEIFWTKNSDDDQLNFSELRVYNDFNLGIQKETEAAAPHHCTYQRSTQADASRLIEDTYSNCDDENVTAHTEILIKGKTIEYSLEKKISRAGKVVVIPAKCTLEKTDDVKIKVKVPLKKNKRSDLGPV